MFHKSQTKINKRILFNLLYFNKTYKIHTHTKNYEKRIIMETLCLFSLHACVHVCVCIQN